MWRYCPGLENPSDIASRGTTSANLANKSIWWEGPAWIHLPQDYWPKQPVLNEPLEDCISEIKESETKVLLCVERQNEVSLENVIALEDYSKLMGLLRITASVLRFVENVQKKMNNGTYKLTHIELSAEEIEKAERLWIRGIQTNVYNDK